MLCQGFVLLSCCFLKACDWPQDDFTCSSLTFFYWFVLLSSLVPKSILCNTAFWWEWETWSTVYRDVFHVLATGIGLLRKSVVVFFVFFLLPSILLLPPHLILLYVYPMRELHTELVTRLMAARLFFPETLSHVCFLSWFKLILYDPSVAVTSKCVVSIALLPLNVFWKSTDSLFKLWTWSSSITPNFRVILFFFQNRELQIMRKLDHCNIVRLRYFFYSSGDKVSPQLFYSSAACLRFVTELRSRICPWICVELRHWLWVGQYGTRKKAIVWIDKCKSFSFLRHF